jgi:hypothetical protein
MKNRKPRKGELNYLIERVIKSALRVTGDAALAIPIVRSRLAKMSKKHNLREVLVEFDTELTPSAGDWKPGHMRPFVECVRVTAYRIRPNRTIGEHKVNLVHWPEGYTWPPGHEREGTEIVNPETHSCVDDPYHNISVLKKAG